MLQNIKAQTADQFKLIEHIKENFYSDAKISVELINENTIKITDSSGDFCFLEMQANGEITEYYQEEFFFKYEL